MRLATTIPLLPVAGATGFALLRAADPDKGVKKADSRIFELRTDTVPEGKMDTLHARFRDKSSCDRRIEDALDGCIERGIEF